MADPIIFSDIDSAFSKNPITKDLVRITNEDAIKTSLKNIIFTGRFERPFQPSLYCGIDEDLFEPITPITANQIKAKIENAVQQFEPRVEEISVQVAMNREDNGYDVTIHYLPKKSLQRTSLSLFIERAI